MGYGPAIEAFFSELEKLGKASGQELATQAKAPRNITNPTNVNLPDPAKPVRREASSTRPGAAMTPNPSINKRLPGATTPRAAPVVGAGNTSDVTGLLTRIGNNRRIIG